MSCGITRSTRSFSATNVPVILCWPKSGGSFSSIVRRKMCIRDRATPFKRDIVKELAAACAKHGIKLHFYYSHLDWVREDYPWGRTGRGTGRPDSKGKDVYKRQVSDWLLWNRKRRNSVSRSTS